MRHFRLSERASANVLPRSPPPRRTPPPPPTYSPHRQTQESRVHQWQETFVFKESEEFDHDLEIFQISYKRCCELFKRFEACCLKDNALSKPLRASIQRNRKIFEIWGLDLNVTHGNLDDRFLRTVNKGLVRVTFTLLTLIDDTLSDNLKYLEHESSTSLFHLSNATRNAEKEVVEYRSAEDDSQTEGRGSDDSHTEDNDSHTEDNDSDDGNDNSLTEHQLNGSQIDGENHGSMATKIESTISHLGNCVRLLMSLTQPIAGYMPQPPIPLPFALPQQQDIFIEHVRLKFPQADEDFIAQCGEYLWKNFERKCRDSKSMHGTEESPIEKGQASKPRTEISRFNDSGLGSTIFTEVSDLAPPDRPQSKKPGNSPSHTISEEDKTFFMNILFRKTGDRDSRKTRCLVCKERLTWGSPTFYYHLADHVGEIQNIAGPCRSRSCSDATSSIAEESSQVSPTEQPVGMDGFQLPAEARENGNHNEKKRNGDPSSGERKNAVGKVLRHNAKTTMTTTSATTEHILENHVLDLNRTPEEDLPRLDDIMVAQGHQESADFESFISLQVMHDVENTAYEKLDGHEGKSHLTESVATLMFPEDEIKRGTKSCDSRSCKRKKPFRNGTDLKRHKLSHGEGVTVSWVCAACNPDHGMEKSWNRRDNFRTHIKTQHPNMDIENLILRSKRPRDERLPQPVGENLLPSFSQDQQYQLETSEPLPGGITQLSFEKNLPRLPYSPGDTISYSLDENPPSWQSGDSLLTPYDGNAMQSSIVNLLDPSLVFWKGVYGA